MGDPRKWRSNPGCLAPVGDDEEDGQGESCGKPATEERAIEGLVFPLGKKHAKEIDDDPETDAEIEVDGAWVRVADLRRPARARRRKARR